MNCQATRPDLAPRSCDHCRGATIQIVHRQTDALAIGPDGGEIGRLVHRREADPQAEAVRNADVFLGILRRGDGAAAFGMIARHQVATVGGRDEQHVRRRPRDTALQARLESLRRGGAVLKGEIVAQDHEAFGATAQEVEQSGKVADLVPVDLDHLQTRRVGRPPT